MAKLPEKNLAARDVAGSDDEIDEAKLEAFVKELAEEFSLQRHHSRRIRLIIFLSINAKPMPSELDGHERKSVRKELKRLSNASTKLLAELHQLSPNAKRVLGEVGLFQQCPRLFVPDIPAEGIEVLKLRYWEQTSLYPSETSTCEPSEVISAIDELAEFGQFIVGANSPGRLPNNLLNQLLESLANFWENELGRPYTLDWENNSGTTQAAHFSTRVVEFAFPNIEHKSIRYAADAARRKLRQSKT